MIRKKRLRKEAKGAIREVGRRRRDRLIEEVEVARKEKDSKREWELLRAIGGRGKGPRKRTTAVGGRDAPSGEDWVRYLAKAGREG